MRHISDMPDIAAPDEVLVRRIPSIKTWAFVHKWSSLVCTAFLLVICLTGLPLLFADEIDGWLDPHSYQALPAATPKASLDRLTAIGRAMYPGQIITSLFVDDDEPQTYLWMAPSWAAMKADEKSEHFIRFDSRTAKVLEESKPRGEAGATFLGVMLSLHRDLFLDLPGELFLGSMALLFVIAIVSGMVLYAPFMRRLDFGAVRRDRSARLKWLDIHNLLGAATLAWVLVVGITGLMNELSTPLFGIWRLTEVRTLLERRHGEPVPAPEALGSVQAAWETTQRHLPDRTITSIIFPGSEDGSAHHFILWAKGATPLTSRLFNPVLVDAVSGEFAGMVKMPWYLRALEISRPLHFGDYGGLPLKILWALLDLVTIGVLGSGLYLWLSHRRSPVPQRIEAYAAAPAEKWEPAE